ncbi:uncharacterized protein LOC129887258 [Solanum dulcamara]|uniref:uncharacterized protein LOC129887258 n=1 Tax=Solanum dulcamara TaxID=45834 RepID=UPI002486259B|nr:uncharacterized protein LOC129887258 [Solanum dulcamara]
MEQLSEEEKKALRGSKFAPLPSALSSSRSQPRLAHPGGSMKTNKAAALAKFLDRKLQDPSGLSSLDPRLIELAVKNAKHTLQSSGASSRGRIVQHVDSFGDSEESAEDEEIKISVQKKSKKNKKRKKLKKEKQHKKLEESSSGTAKKPKKKLKL